LEEIFKPNLVKRSVQQLHKITLILQQIVVGVTDIFFVNKDITKGKEMAIKPSNVVASLNLSSM
jgi:hypothetical protein